MKDKITEKLTASFERMIAKAKSGESPAEQHNDQKREARRLACKRYNNSEHGKAHHRQYNKANREKFNEIRKKWLEKHPGYDTERQRRYRQKNPEKMQEISKRYYESHREEILQRIKEKNEALTPEEKEIKRQKNREYYKKWAAKNPDKVAQYKANRKKKKEKNENEAN